MTLTDTRAHAELSPADLARDLTAHGIDHWTEPGRVLIPEGRGTAVIRPSGDPVYPWHVTTHDGPDTAPETDEWHTTTAALIRDLGPVARVMPDPHPSPVAAALAAYEAHPTPDALAALCALAPARRPRHPAARHTARRTHLTPLGTWLAAAATVAAMFTAPHAAAAVLPHLGAGR